MRLSLNHIVSVLAVLVAAPFVAAAQPAVPTAQIADAVPLPLKAFLDPPTLSLVKVSPSGKAIAMVRRVGDIDQVVVTKIGGTRPLVPYETSPVSTGLAKLNFRESIRYLAWKSDDTLLISVDVPVGYRPQDSYYEPIHMVLSADGAAPPLPLNASMSGKTAVVESSRIQSLLKDDPDHVMIRLDKGSEHVELYRVNIHDASRVLLETGGADVTAYETNRRGDIIIRVRSRDSGVLIVEGRAAGQTEWSRLFDLRHRDEVNWSKYKWSVLDKTGTLYVAAKPDGPADGDTDAIRTYDIKAHATGPVVWSNPTYDISSAVIAEDGEKLMGGCYWVDTLQCDLDDPVLSDNLKRLNAHFGGRRNVLIVSLSDDHNYWIIEVSGPDDPGSYFYFDINTHHLAYLGAQRPELPFERLGHMRRMDFASRDGHSLSAYVTEPPGASAGLLPLVVLPHGGPEMRDHYDYDQLTQFLATRGYVVLQPNFRGSGGFGRKYAQSGYGQWGERMHDDVMDATKSLIGQGRIDPKRVCIVGGSYGGYEALYAAGAEPGAFACAVSISGLSDLVRWVKSTKTYGDSADPERFDYWRKSVGDLDTDIAKLEAHSPYRFAPHWTTPLLLIHGDADGIVPVEQSREMKHALDSAGKPVRYVEVKDMGHGPRTDEEVTKVYGEIETFLATYLKSGAPATAKP